MRDGGREGERGRGGEREREREGGGGRGREGDREWERIREGRDVGVRKAGRVPAEKSVVRDLHAVYLA